MSKVDKAEKRESPPPRPLPELVHYEAGVIHPTEPSRAAIGSEFLTHQSPVVRVDKWQAPGNDVWNLYSIQVLALNTNDSSEIQSVVSDVPCPYCALRVRHTKRLCDWFRQPIALAPAAGNTIGTEPAKVSRPDALR